MMWNASRISSSFHFVLSYFKSIRGFSLGILVESSCFILHVQSSLTAFQFVKSHPVFLLFFNELLTVLLGKVHKFCICCTEEIRQIGMASE